MVTRAALVAILAVAAPLASQPSTGTPRELSIPASGDWGSPTAILSPGTDGVDWDGILWGNGPNSLVKVGSTYYLFYGAAITFNEPAGTPEFRAIGVATGTSLATLSKYGSNPIVQYTTTAFVEIEEGATNASVILDGSTWRMYYAASRYVGPGLVDVDIRYRDSTDGLTWSNDTLIYQDAGNEWVPISAYRRPDGTWILYAAGPLTSGRGQLKYFTSTDPTSMGSPTLALAVDYNSGGMEPALISNTKMLLPLQTNAGWAISWRTATVDVPGTISSELAAYGFTSYQKASLMLDRDAGLWRLVQFDSTGGADDGKYVMRTASIAW